MEDGCLSLSGVDWIIDILDITFYFNWIKIDSYCCKKGRQWFYRCTSKQDRVSTTRQCTIT